MRISSALIVSLGLLALVAGCSGVDDTCPPGQVFDENGLCVLPCQFVTVNCDDANDCTVDDCENLQDGTAECSNVPKSDDATCIENGIAGWCVSGQCDFCAMVNCDDANDCTADGECDPTNGSCPNKTPEPSGTACGMDRVCDGRGNCAACTDNSQCGDGNPCTSDICDSIGSCDHFNANGEVCDLTPGSADGQCNGGVCLDPGAACLPNPCDDGHECTQNVCEALGANSHECTHPAKPRGDRCSDGIRTYCDGLGTCVQCIDNSQCGDGNQCTQDICDSIGSCNNPPEPPNAPCSEGERIRCDGAGSCVECNSNEQCNDGNQCTSNVCESICKGVVCNDDEECTDDACDPADGSCDNTPLPDGALCSGGACMDATCGTVFPCTEQGIRDAIAHGGGPLTFSCNGPTTVTTTAQVNIDNDVILDGEGELKVDGNGSHPVFYIGSNQTAELRRIAMSGGRTSNRGGSIENHGALTLTDSTVSGSTAVFGGGIYNDGTLTAVASTVSGNTAMSGGIGGAINNDGEMTLTRVTLSGNDASLHGGGVYNTGTMTVAESTVSGNTANAAGGGIFNTGTLTVTNSTLSSNSALGSGGGGIWQEGGALVITSSTLAMRSGTPNAIFFRQAPTTLTNTVIEGPCDVSGSLAFSRGEGNIESPGDTCRFNDAVNLVNISSNDLKLGALASNGGPTLTHALSSLSAAIDQIEEQDCVDPDGLPLATDQRGVVRPRGTKCDVGAFEFEP